VTLPAVAVERRAAERRLLPTAPAISRYPPSGSRESRSKLAAHRCCCIIIIVLNNFLIPQVVKIPEVIIISIIIIIIIDGTDKRMDGHTDGRSTVT